MFLLKEHRAAGGGARLPPGRENDRHKRPGTGRHAGRGHGRSYLVHFLTLEEVTEFCVGFVCERNLLAGDLVEILTRDAGRYGDVGEREGSSADTIGGAAVTDCLEAAQRFLL